MLIFLIPSQFEAKDFLSRLEHRRAFRVSYMGSLGPVVAEGAHGEIAGIEVVVGIIGMGPPHAARRAEAVIRHAHTLSLHRGKNSHSPFSESARAGQRSRAPAANGSTGGIATTGEPHGVLLCGFAGALHPRLKRGEIFVTTGAEHIVPHLPEQEQPREAPLHTSDGAVSTAADKAALLKQTGAWLVDMEQADVALITAAAGLPLIGVRIISDEAQEDLPQELLSRAYDQAEGEYTPLKLAGHLTRHPFKVKELASFVLPLGSIRNRMSERLHTWLTLAGPKLFQLAPPSSED